VLLVLHGLPKPEVGWVLQDVRRRRAVWLDLAYPEQRIGIEYEGEEHTKPVRVLRDIGRGTDLVDQGWRLYRFTKYEVYGEPDEIVAKVERALGA
jgi:very-short-patch-repair endonuclease